MVNEEVVEKICRIIRKAHLYALQQYHPAEVLHPEFFESEDRLFSDAEMGRLRSVAAPRVRECMLR